MTDSEGISHSETFTRWFDDNYVLGVEIVERDGPAQGKQSGFIILSGGQSGRPDFGPCLRLPGCQAQAVCLGSEALLLATGLGMRIGIMCPENNRKLPGKRAVGKLLSGHIFWAHFPGTFSGHGVPILMPSPQLGCTHKKYSHKLLTTEWQSR
jgi:hypothetical protein